MSDALRQAVLEYTARLDRREGVAITPVDGLCLIRSTTPTSLEYTVEQPLVCFVLQGCKQVTVGRTTSSYAAGDTMVVTGNSPMASRISTASITDPYLALALDLDAAVLTDLVLNTPDGHSLGAEIDTRRDLHDALHRLLRLMDRPESLAVLKDGLVREIHHWLLMSGEGWVIRQMGQPNSRNRRIARAVAILRAEYKQRIGIDRLAAESGMSRSALHLHFRAMTSLSPLQFQKQLRLMEARRYILNDGKSLSEAGFAVGYESASQFSREYARMYGHPPMTDKRTVSDRRKTGGTGK